MTPGLLNAKGHAIPSGFRCEHRQASSCLKAHCFPRLGAEGLQRIMENYGVTMHPAL